MLSVDCIIIGAGVVGLSIARQLAHSHEVFVLEKNTSAGLETSSRNSEVIHAGLYHPPKFLKTQLCHRGRELLYTYCQEKSIAHKRCGKLLVASSADEIPSLKKWQQQACQYNLTNQWISQEQLQEQAPLIRGAAALEIKETGIIDSAQLLQQLEIDTIQRGSHILFQHEVSRINITQNGFQLQVITEKDVFDIHCKTLINAAGLHAHTLDGNTPISPNVYFCKGQYFRYSGKALFHQPIYPLPSANNMGLGIHLTPNIHGDIKFGPDAHYINQNNIDYRVNESSKDDFLKAIQRYFPSIEACELQSDFAGIRPKLTTAHEAASDFIIATQRQHGVKNLVQCFGIESPGLTASLGIAEYIESQLCR